MAGNFAQLKDRAAAAFRDGNLHDCVSLTKQAMETLEAAVKDGVDGVRSDIARELSRCRSNLAAAHLELEDYKQAAEDASAAIELDPSWHRPYLRLCAALTALRRSSDAAADVLRTGLARCQDPDQLRELQSALSALCSVSTADAGAKRPRLPDDGSEPLTTRKRLAKSATPSAASTVTRGGVTLATTKPASIRLGTCHRADQGQSKEPHRILPVTALCGFLGAGKTTLVRHLLARLGAGAAARVGLLVNDLAPTNIDAQLLALPPPPQTVAAPTAAADGGGRDGSGSPQLPGEILELSNGCVCCNLRGELQHQLRRLAAREPFLEHLVVECTGVGEPAALATAVRALAAEGTRVELWRMVTVVDASAFLDMVGLGGATAGGEVPKEQRRRQQDDGAGRPGSTSSGRGSSSDAEGRAAAADRSRRPLAQLLVQQVESADVVVLNKCDRLLERVRQQQRQHTGRPPLPLPQQQRASEAEGRQQHGGGSCTRGPNGGSTVDDTAHGNDPAVEAEEGADVSRAAALPSAEVQAQAQALALQELRRVRSVVRALNPSAHVLQSVRCDVPVEAILGPPPLPPPRNESRSPGGGLRPPAPESSPSVPQQGCDGDAHTMRKACPGAVEAGAPAVPWEGSGGAAARDGGGAAGTRGRQGATRGPSFDADADAGGGVVGTDAGLLGTATETQGVGPDGHATGGANEEEEYGIGSYVFRSRVPFHPARLWALLQAMADGDTLLCNLLEGEQQGLQEAAAVAAVSSAGAVEGCRRVGSGTLESDAAAPVSVVLPRPPPHLLRAKGFFWLASLPQAIWELSLAGGQVEVEAVGRWLCTMVDPDHWPVGPRQAPAAPGSADKVPLASGSEGDRGNAGGGSPCDDAPEVMYGSSNGSVGDLRPRRWHVRWGDRCNELVFIGLGLELGAATASDGPKGPGPEATAACGGSGGSDGGASNGGGGARDTSSAQSPGGARERLAALLQWAQLTPTELAAGEEVWEGWEDATWLGLLERY